jgi:hypothetical protein
MQMIAGAIVLLAACVLMGFSVGPKTNSLDLTLGVVSWGFSWGLLIFGISFMGAGAYYHYKTKK